MLYVGGSSNFRGESQAMLMFESLELMKKTMIVALGVAASVCPHLETLLLLLLPHIPMHPCIHILFHAFSLHTHQLLGSGKVVRNVGFKRNV